MLSRIYPSNFHRRSQKKYRSHTICASSGLVCFALTCSPFPLLSHGHCTTTVLLLSKHREFKFRFPVSFLDQDVKGRIFKVFCTRKSESIWKIYTVEQGRRRDKKLDQAINEFCKQEVGRNQRTICEILQKQQKSDFILRIADSLSQQGRRNVGQAMTCGLYYSLQEV